MTHFSIGEACISSVCIKESGFMDYRFTAYKAAEELGFKVIRNPENTGITQNSFSNILRQNSPIFILLVGDEDSKIVEDECKLAFERGLPIFAFLKVKHNNDIESNINDKEKEVFVDEEKYISNKTRKIMEKISQSTYNNDCALFSSCEELYYAIQFRLNNYIEQRIRLSPKIEYNKGSTYYYAYEQILAAKKRIILSQKTSLLILGPRKGNTYEHRTYDALFDWLTKNWLTKRNSKNNNNNLQFMHLFCRTNTIKEAKEGKNENIYDISAAKSRLCELLKKVRDKDCQTEDPNFCFRFIDEHSENVAHLMTDTGFQLVLPIAGNIFNVVLPYYFTPEEQLMKIITHLHSMPFVSYNDIENLYEEIEIESGGES